MKRRAHIFMAAIIALVGGGVVLANYSGTISDKAMWGSLLVVGAVAAFANALRHFPTK